MPHDVTTMTFQTKYTALILGNITYYGTINSIPSHAFMNWYSLDTLNMANVGLAQIEQKSFSGLGNLTKLDICNNKLHNLEPNVFAEMENLEKLNLEKNDVNSLFLVFVGLSNLRQLYLGGNKIVNIEGGFEGLYSLEVLDLSCNFIQDLSYYFCGMINLHTLRLSQNYLNTLHRSGFYCLTLLRFLDLSHNQLEVLPDDVFTNLHNLQELDVSGNKLTIIGISLNYGLRILSLSNNSLNTFNATESWWNIEELHVDHNQLSDLEFIDTMKHMPSLRKLSLGFNKYSCADSRDLTSYAFENGVTLLPFPTILLAQCQDSTIKPRTGTRNRSSTYDHPHYKTSLMVGVSLASILLFFVLTLGFIVLCHKFGKLLPSIHRRGKNKEVGDRVQDCDEVYMTVD